jgi:hypothetical protein
MFGFNGHNACGIEDGIMDLEKDVLGFWKN